MAAFQFPDPADQKTVVNPITGSTYQWKEPPGKWVVTVSVRQVEDIIWEGDSPPDPIGDYKLWYSTDTLELYFHYTDANGVSAWVPTSAPITMLEDLDEGLFEVRQLLNQVNSAAITNENDIILIRESLGKVNLQEVLDNGNTADKGAEFGGTVTVNAGDTTADGDPLFAVEGDQANDGTGVNLLVARRHSQQGDQVRYYGPIVNAKELTTKEYVDSNADLDGVLNNGNVSDLGAEFGGDVTINAKLNSEGFKNFGDATFKLSSGNTVVIDSGSTYEALLNLKSYSGPGQRKDVLNVYAGGNAELLGKLKLAPGEADNEAVTYGQLATVAEEIEQVIPAYERGEYNFSTTEVVNSSATRGTYNLIRPNNSSDSSDARQACEDAFNTCKRIPDADPIDCQRDYNRCLDQIPANGTLDTYVDTFTDVTKVKISQYDAKGAKHEWTDVAVGQIIDIFNDDNDDYFVGEITGLTKTTNVITLDVKKTQAKGKATGKARVKIFTLNNEIDELTNYVRKTGDQMTGTLETTGRILIRPGDQGAKGGNNMLVVNQQSSKGQASIARFQQDGDDIIKVQYDRTTTFNHNRITEVGEPEHGEDAVNMQWVENYVAANVRRLWKWTGDQTSTPGEGKFSWAQSGAGYCYFDHRPFIGSELYCSGNKYFCKGGDSQAPDKEMGYAFMTLWEWTGSRWEPVMSGHLSASGVRTGKNNEPWRFSADKNSILKLKDMTTDGLYSICVAGTILA